MPKKDKSEAKAGQNDKPKVRFLDPTPSPSPKR